MDNRISRERQPAGNDKGQYQASVRQQIRSEVDKIIEDEIRNAARELAEERRKAMRQAVEEHRQLIREIVEEKKLEITSKVDELKRSINRLAAE